MIRVDYFVITTPRNAAVDAHFPSIIGQYVSKPQEDRIMQYYGYRGDNKVFVGQSTDRIMIWSSGQHAHYVAKTLNTNVFESFSVARIDLQVTMTSLDADYMIEYIQPKDDPIARKKRWLEQSVLPALRRLLVEDKQYVDNFVKLLYNGVDDGSSVDMY
jgi:hypothetical protein